MIDFRKINDKLFVLDDGFWHTCKVRKPFVCKVSGRLFPTGTMALRPLSNRTDRSDRIALESLTIPRAEAHP